jgi:hypothetical protein
MRRDTGTAPGSHGVGKTLALLPAPIGRPPAALPLANTLSVARQPAFSNAYVASMKSVKLFF